MSRVLCYSAGTEYAGAERMLVTLVGHLRGTGWEPVMAFHAGRAGERLSAEARALDVESVTIPPGCGWTAVPRLARHFRASRADVIHLHMSWQGDCRPALIAARLARPRAIVVTIHLFIPSPSGRPVGWRRRLRRRLALLVDRLVDAHVAVSDGVAVKLQQRGLAREQVVVVRNGVSMPEGPPKPAASNRRAGQPIALTVARLDAQKGHRYLIDAAAKLDGVTFLLAGEGPLAEELSRQVAELGIGERVRFLGRRDDVPSMLDEATVVVLPSLYEGLPLAALEAMAHGKAIVATAIDGTTEALSESEAVLVPPGDADALASAIGQLVADPERRKELGRSARRRVQAEFSADRMAAEYARLYEAVLSGGRRADNSSR